jgi:LPXTG-motif cell wall-anchored protein
MTSGAHRSTNIWIGRRVVAVTASMIGLVAVFAGASVAQAAPPVAPTPPADVNVQCKADVPPAVELTAVDAEDGDITVSPVDVTTPETPTTNDYVIERTWTFKDTDSEITEVSQTITVEDTTPPVFDNVPGDVTVIGSANIPVAAKLATTDNCNGAIQSGDPVDDPATPSNDQVITRTWEVTDKTGNVASATQTITVVPTAADLQITATASPGPVNAGEALVYTITVKNLGPDTATGVRVTTSPITGATTSGCTNDPAGAASCTLGDLAKDASAVFTVTVTVPADTKGNLARTWQASSLLADIDPTNNAATTDVVVTAKATMFVSAAVVVTETSSATTTTAAGSSSALAAGDPVDIAITVGNTGPSAAADATVTATFSASITDLAIVDDGLYTCLINSKTLSCTLASHPVGTNVVIKLSGALTGTSTDVFVGPVIVDSASGDAATTSSILVTVVPPTSTTVVTTTTQAPTTTASTTTTVAPTVATTAPASGGAIPATGADNSNVIRASIIALLAGLAAVILARRRPQLAAALRPAGWFAGRQAELPTRRVTSNGVSTVIEEPTRSPRKQ